MATTIDLQKQNNAFNALMLRWLAFMEKTFPNEPCFSNLLRLMSDQSNDNMESPLLYFFNNNMRLQDTIRACDNDYFNALPDQESQDLMGTLNIAMPVDFKTQVDALPIEEQTKIWHFINELLTIAIRVHPDLKMEGLPDSPFNREQYPFKLFMSY